MRPESPDGWQRLTCSCGTERFAAMIHLRWRMGAGITQEPAGFFCLECHAIVDSATLIQKAQYKAKQQEMRELEADMASVQATVPKQGPSASASVVGMAKGK